MFVRLNSIWVPQWPVNDCTILIYIYIGGYSSSPLPPNNHDRARDMSRAITTHVGTHWARDTFALMNSVTPCPPKIAIPHTIMPYRTPPIFSIFSMPQHIHTQPAFLSHSIIKVVLKGPFASIRHITYFHHLGLVHHRLSTSSFSSSPSINTTLYFIENDPELISQKWNLHEGYDTA